MVKKDIILITIIILVFIGMVYVSNLLSSIDSETSSEVVKNSTFQTIEKNITIVPIRKEISIYVSEFGVEYSESWVFSEKEFSLIIKNLTLAKQSNIDELLDRLCGCSVKVYSTGSFSLDEAGHKLKLTLMLYPKIIVSDNKTIVDMGWLFKSLRSDVTLLDFNVSKNILSWKGNIETIPTTILIELPYFGKPYSYNNQYFGFSEQKVWWTNPSS